MCGIGGILYKPGSGKRKESVGSQLVSMLDAMAHRGRDSTGVTVSGEDIDCDYIVRIWSDPSIDYEAGFKLVEDRVLSNGGHIVDHKEISEYLRLGIEFEGEISILAQDLMSISGIEIHSIGRSSEVVKDVGTGTTLERRHQVSNLNGTHGIGHVRMATESRVDITHAHPFWAYPFPDITVVHNGQITNYHRMKREYIDMGHRFQTENDSELIAVYLADRLSRGASLQESLADSQNDLDGTFTYLVSTENGLGVAKDQWAAKPLVLIETEQLVALASEEVALRSIFPGEFERTDPQESEVMTWVI